MLYIISYTSSYCGQEVLSLTVDFSPTQKRSTFPHDAWYHSAKLGRCAPTVKTAKGQVPSRPL